MKLRTGRNNRYNLYWQQGAEPAKTDISVGYCRTEFLSAQVVDLVNIGIQYIRGDLVASTITYATVVACLNQDINQPCPVGVGTYNPDDERYDSVKNNAEAVIVLQKPAPTEGNETDDTEQPPASVSQEQPTGETQAVASASQVSEDPVDPVEKPTQAEAQQDTSLTDEGEEVFGVDAGLEMPDSGPDASVETSDPFVKDDFVIEVVASSMERLSEIVTWVNEKLMHLTHGDAIRDHVCFADYEALTVGSETRYVTYAPAEVEEEVDEE